VSLREQSLDPGLLCRNGWRCPLGGAEQVTQARRERQGNLGCILRQCPGESDRVDPALGLTDRRQESVDEITVQRRPPRTNLLEQVLGGMQHQPHGRVVEQPDRALQRVDGAKGAVDQCTVVRPPLQRQEVVGRLLHQFAALDQELFEQFVGHDCRPGRW
jgi:hypothetical protein